MTTSHDLMRAAIESHAITRDEIAVYMATHEPRITSKFAGQLFDALMAGHPCKMILAQAIVALTAQKLRITEADAVDAVLLSGKPTTYPQA